MDLSPSESVSGFDANPERLRAIEAQMAQLQQEQHAIQSRMAMQSHYSLSSLAQHPSSNQAQHYGASTSPAAAAMPRSKSHMGTRASHAPCMTTVSFQTARSVDDRPTGLFLRGIPSVFPSL